MRSIINYKIYKEAIKMGISNTIILTILQINKIVRV